MIKRHKMKIQFPQGGKRVKLNQSDDVQLNKELDRNPKDTN